MAIIRSLAIGKAKKSAGNITFRTVRGRTIVSEKVAPRPVTRVDGALSQYEARFKLISMFIGAHRADINVSFDKTKYGSQGNYFYKINKAGLEAAVDTLLDIAATATLSEVNEAISTYATANPEAIYRVKRTGYESKYLTGEWLSKDNPVTPVSSTVSSISVDGKVLEDNFGSESKNPGASIIISGTNLDSTTLKMFFGGDYDTTDAEILEGAKVLNTVISITSQTKKEIAGTLISKATMGAVAIVENGQIIYERISMNPLG